MPRKTLTQFRWFLDVEGDLEVAEDRLTLHEFQAATEKRAKTQVRKLMRALFGNRAGMSGTVSLAYGEVDDPIPVFKYRKRWSGKVEFEEVESPSSRMY